MTHNSDDEKYNLDSLDFSFRSKNSEGKIAKSGDFNLENPSSESELSSEPPEKSDLSYDRLEMHASDSKSSHDKKPKKPKKSFFRRLINIIFSLIILGTFSGAIAFYALYQWAAADLPSFSKVADYRPAQVTTVLARDGSLIGQFYREKRYVIELNQMAPHVPLAFLAVEDSEFYEHPGINLTAIVRAFIANLQSGTIRQGASTITQQIVKRLMLTPEKSYERKLKEAILAFRLEKQLSKDDILTIYLNQIFLGNNAYGIEAAARTYFNKHASDLSIAEAAMLAGLPQSPSANNPYRHPKAARERQEHVLRRMRTLGWISDQEFDRAFYEQLNYATMSTFMGREGGWYLEEVRRQLISIFSEESSAKFGFEPGVFGEDVVYEMGLTVYTSMDPTQQKAADFALRKGLEDATKRHGWLGPIKNLTATEARFYLDENPFSILLFEEGKWQKAVVESVTNNGATVRIGALRGFIPVSAMGWARVPNKKISGLWRADSVKDARKVLAVGDLVWTSFRPVDAKTKALFPKDVPVLDDLSELSATAILDNSRKNTGDGAINSHNSIDLVSLASPKKQTHLNYTSNALIPLALEQYPTVQGALVSIEPQTGDVVALVGGYEFSYNGDQFNRATQAERQVGSSFKPIVYAAALEKGFTAGSMLLDAPILLIDEYTKDVWRPNNFDGKFDGPIRFNRALARSRNLSTIRIAQEIGIGPVIEKAREFGFKGDLYPALSTSLGAGTAIPVDLASSYTAFASLGERAIPRYIQKIEGPWGNTIYRQPPRHEYATSPQNAYVMAKILQGVIQYGTATKAKVLENPIAGKTGSTNDEVDAWFIGFTPNLVTATYIGYDLIEPMGRGETGTGAALPIYIDYAKEALKHYPVTDFIQPQSIYFATVDGISLPFYAGTSVRTGVNIVRTYERNSHAREVEDLLMQEF